MGSLEVGKDADFVIWSDNPLSTNAKCEQTWIEGKKYFDIKDDKELRSRDSNLFNLLVQKALNSNEDIDKGNNKKNKLNYLKHSCGTHPNEDEF